MAQCFVETAFLRLGAKWTNLYNARAFWKMSWRDNALKALDTAAAYGWADYTPQMPDEEILRRLLALNLARASAQGA